MLLLCRFDLLRPLSCMYCLVDIENARVLKVAVEQWAPHIVVAWVHDDVALALCLRERKDRGLLKIGRKRILIMGLK